MNINIQIVPNDVVMQRKQFTGADWWWEDENLQVRIAKLGDWREEMCLAMHEVSEAIMCKHMKISHESVDVFDSKYQHENEIDLNAGDEPDAPYRIPHCYATAIERVMAGVLDIDWKSYDKKLSLI